MTVRPDGMEWRHLELCDIPGLATFAPEEWHLALDEVLLQHFGRAYFLARVGATEAGILAIGQGIVTGRIGWLGNIIVRPDSRNRGLGTRATQEVMDGLRVRGCSSMLLVATAPGEPVYRKLGFRITADYVFMEVPRLPPFAAPAIRRLVPPDLEAVLALDSRATGENRAELLVPHLAAGWVHAPEDDFPEGFFLPSLGAGLVIAGTRAAGVSLLRFKHAFFRGAAVVPAANTAALAFLRECGARETARAPRMVLGDEAEWQPEWIFARAAGYCG